MNDKMWNLGIKGERKILDCGPEGLEQKQKQKVFER